MDPLTHCLVGGMAAKTLGTSKRRFWIMCLLGSIPDLDVVFNGLSTNWAWIVQHRGISHSLIGIALQAAFFAWALGRWDKGPFRERAWQYSLPIIGHVLCDYLTAFGVPLLSPFAVKEYSADLMVGLTLIPMFIMSVGLTWVHLKGERGWRGTRPVWIGWALYMCMAVSGKAYASKLVDVPGAITLPSTGNPFTWSVVCPDADGKIYKRYELDLFRGRRFARAAVAMPGEELPIRASLNSVDVQQFLQSNRWPVARAIPVATGGWDVEWGNLLFSTRGMVRGKIRVRVEADGTVLEGQRIFSFWNPETPGLTVPVAS